jgi:hypothetical protein
MLHAFAVEESENWSSLRRGNPEAGSAKWNDTSVL